MTQPSKHETKDIALIVGGGPGISSSCARLFSKSGMSVGVAARNPEKSALQDLEKTHGVRRYACDASEPAAVKMLFENVVRDLGALRSSCTTSTDESPAFLERELPTRTRAWRSRCSETRRSARSWWVSRQPGSCAKTNRTRTAPKDRSSLQMPAQRSKASHRAVHLQWHAMQSLDSRKAWRGS